MLMWREAGASNAVDHRHRWLWIPGSRRFTSRPGMTKMICPTGKSAKSCLAQVAKIYRFAFDPKHLYKRAVSCPLRGAYHGRRETLARDAMDAGGIEGERYRCGRQSRVVLAPDAGVKFAGSACRRRWQTSPITGESAE